MRVEDRGFNRFVVSEGIVEVHCHIERYNHTGIKQLWIDKIEIHGSIEATELRTILRKIHKHFIEKHGVFR